MKQISMKLQNCYGIKKLEHVFDFNKKSNYLLYASNGMMKTSFTKTMKAVASKKKPMDEVFERKTSCEILVDEVDETKPGMYYAVYKSPSEIYKNVTLIRNIVVLGAEV